MKIVGITYYDGTENVVLKSDSSMLVNRKPLFVPERIHALACLPCWVLRVSRLGKCIAPRFASRYYDAVAPGADFFGADVLAEAKREGKPWTEAIAFEGSLAIGEWDEVESRKSKVESSWRLEREGESVGQMTWDAEGLQQLFDNALSRASELMTIRQGDLIYVARKQEPWLLQAEDILRCSQGEKETLYCKIK
ncbi:MAG: hypothetical protein J6P74_04030 [Paludibacteraceae bacterium]|nr:hypothetical protein [Paludibacteraceae bacterium]